MGLSLWSQNLAKLTLFCVQHRQHRVGCGDASIMGLSLWSDNLEKLTIYCVQHRQHRAGCGDASMMGLSLWSENQTKLTLLCVQHGQHRAGCGDQRAPDAKIYHDVRHQLSDVVLTLKLGPVFFYVVSLLSMPSGSWASSDCFLTILTNVAFTQ